MITSESLEMGCYRSRDLSRFLNLKKVTHDLSLMGRLPRQALHGIPLRENFGVCHNLDLLGWLRDGVEGIRHGRYGAVHQLQFGVEGVVEESL